MSITTVDKQPEDKRQKIKRLREFHQKTFDELGVPDAIFIPKMAYRPYGKTELHIGFFASEMGKGDDIFVEFCSKDNDPEYEDRGLYRWRYNPHFEEEYEKTEPLSTTGSVRYLVPIAELVKVKSYKQNDGEVESKLEEMPNLDIDLPLNQITLRDLAAILLKKPVSKKDWLNQIISKA